MRERNGEEKGKGGGDEADPMHISTRLKKGEAMREKLGSVLVRRTSATRAAPMQGDEAPVRGVGVNGRRGGDRVGCTCCRGEDNDDASSIMATTTETWE